ncbi:MAG TPA: AAA family ATPase, partial [Gammaproteobacteria bacterium]
MQLTRLTVRDLRLIEAAELAPGPGLNLLVGANASGKTTLLEAIYLLGRGRPLRQRHAARLIRDGREQMLVSGSLSERDGSRHVLGVARAAGRLELRRDGQAARSSLELAALLPLQFIHPEIHHLVQAGPVLRRQFLDRGLFHVEPNVLDGWCRYQRALRQRNAALKSG